jgi:hypothetical protein
MPAAAREACQDPQQALRGRLRPHKGLAWPNKTAQDPTRPREAIPDFAPRPSVHSLRMGHSISRRARFAERYVLAAVNSR